MAFESIQAIKQEFPESTSDEEQNYALSEPSSSQIRRIKEESPDTRALHIEEEMDPPITDHGFWTATTGTDYRKVKLCALKEGSLRNGSYGLDIDRLEEELRCNDRSIQIKREISAEMLDEQNASSSALHTIETSTQEGVQDDGDQLPVASGTEQLLQTANKIIQQNEQKKQLKELQRQAENSHMLGAGRLTAISSRFQGQSSSSGTVVFMKDLPESILENRELTILREDKPRGRPRESAEVRREKDRLRKQASRKKESEETKALRRQRDRERKATFRANLSDEELQRKNAMSAKYAAERRKNETDDEKQKRNAQNALRAALRRQNETSAQKEVRNEKNRLYMAKKRQRVTGGVDEER
ncbi:hypothetical protein QR680_002360 [Steinernema hermaphroditum]|uniref:Uncharacterized protein n=1 Tax=Steinernema hermaphroditum TaxID=289476 RepID=A0AA39H469_9BILA|nr:hypothetical protein QR680_002360 [Steinernema hermaphroditum]